LAVMGLAALTIFFSAGYGPREMRAVGWVLACVAPFILLREYARRFLFAHLNVVAAVAMDVAVSCLQIAGLIVLVYFGMLTVPMVYMVMGAACALALVIWVAANRQPLGFQRDQFVADWKENWKFGKWAFICQLTGFAFYILPWLLTYVHGKAATGMFAVSNTLVGLASLFVIGMCNFLTPKAAHAFAQQGSAGLGRLLRTTIIVFTASLGLFCLIAAVLGNYFAVIIYGPKYNGAGSIIAVLAVATLIDAWGLTANNGLWAIDRPAANFPADIVILMVTLGTALLLVHPMGALGIAIAMALGRAAGAVVRWGTLWGLIGAAEFRIKTTEVRVS
jgi:O-antigen/teichoic acid export membrane protein